MARFWLFLNVLRNLMERLGVLVEVPFLLGSRADFFRVSREGLGYIGFPDFPIDNWDAHLFQLGDNFFSFIRHGLDPQGRSAIGLGHRR
jgi:hypothetical protein